MPFSNIGWWLIILLNFIGYFVIRFAKISDGALKEVVEIVGMILTIASFVLMLIFFGFIQMVLLLFILWIIVTPLVMFVLSKIENKLYPHRREMEKRLSKEYGISVEELRSRRGNNMTTEEILEETLPGIFKKDSDEREKGL